jgi:hypothetical protein
MFCANLFELNTSQSIGRVSPLFTQTHDGILLRQYNDEYSFIKQRVTLLVDQYGLWDNEGLMSAYGQKYGEKNVVKLLLLMSTGLKIGNKCYWGHDWYVEDNIIYINQTWWFGSERPNDNAAEQLNEALAKHFGIGTRDWGTFFGDIITGGLKVVGGGLTVKAGMAVSTLSGGLAAPLGWTLGVTGGSTAVEGVTQMFGYGDGWNPAASLSNQLFGETGETAYRVVDIGVGLIGGGSSFLKLKNLQKFRKEAFVTRASRNGKAVQVHHLTGNGERIMKIYGNENFRLQMAGHFIEVVSATASVSGSLETE